MKRMVGLLFLLALAFVPFSRAADGPKKPDDKTAKPPAEKPADKATAATKESASANKLILHTRARVETEKGSGNFALVAKTVEWEPAKTAIVICDMWDQHWCQGATRRVAEMAPRMNEVIAAARAKGVLIVHCPSSCM